MKPASFRYLAPRSEDELLAVLGEHGADARLLAGGQSLVPMMNFRVVSPAVIVDINHIKTLSFIKHASGGIDVGALTRHAMLEDSDPVRAELPIVTEAMGYLAHRAVRNRGTIGGSLALAYPNAELPLLFVALGAELRLHSRTGERRLPVSEFITGRSTPCWRMRSSFIPRACRCPRVRPERLSSRSRAGTATSRSLRRRP